MSEVNIYYAVPHSMSACAGPGRSAVVFQNEHRRELDRVTAERDAALGREDALREENLKVRDMHAKQCCVFCNDSGNLRAVNAELQQRLTAADEREDALGSLVPEAELALKALNVAVSVFDVELADSARRGLRLIIAALKPAEFAKCAHSYHTFGDYPRRRCNLCNKLEPIEGGGDEA